jgi:hypothetical protein
VTKPAAKPTANRSLLLLPILLLAAVGAWIAYQQIAAMSAASAARQDLFAELDEELAKEPIDGGAMSRLMARLDKLEGADADPQVAFARGRIELARDRVDRAYDAFAAVGTRPEADEAERRLLVAILLRKHQAGSADPAQAIGWLRDAAERAAAIAERNDSLNDWFVAWQAAVRLEDAASVTRARERLLALDRESLAARLAVAQSSFRPEGPADELHALRGEFGKAPPELLAMIALAQLQAGELPKAVAELDAVLLAAPGLLAVRWCAALIYHACALASQTPEQGASWRTRRDAQLDWLERNAAPEDSRRATWTAMRQA